MNSVQKGRSFDFDITVSGDDADAFAPVFDVLQYPGDTPAIAARAMTADSDSDGRFLGTLSGTDTDALAVGQWFIHVRMSDADENIAQRIKLYVEVKWS